MIYIGMEYVRKISLALAVTMTQKYIWLQYMILCLSSTFLIILTGFLRTRQVRASNLMDRFNEAKLIVIMYHIICFTQFVPDPETQFLVGYSCMAVVISGLSINMIELVTQPVRLCRRQFTICMAKRKEKRQRLRKRFETKGFNERRIKSWQQTREEI